MENKRLSAKFDLGYLNSTLYMGFLAVFLLVWLFVARGKDYRGILMDPSDYLTTEGVVISTNVVDRSKAWHFVIVYEYSVNGKTYQSDKISFAATGQRLRLDALEITAQYPVGKTVQVYYDTNDPSFAVINPEVHDFSVIITPAILLLIALLCFGGYIRMRFFTKGK